MPLQTLQRYWGYPEFRPGQLQIVESVLSGHDTIGLLPTGGGKSITFQVPAMLLPGLTVVVTPLISLMKDQVDNLRNRAIRAGLIHSGMTRSEVNNTLTRCRLGKNRIVYVSPERLQNEAFVHELKTWDVSLLVVDEAHCISQWGYDFRPSYLAIGDLRKHLPGVPVLALTASATPRVVSDIADKLHMADPRIFVRSFTRDNLSYIVRRDESKLTRLLAVLANTQGSTIVYVRSRRRCAMLCEEIRRAGVTADFYHAGLSNEDKDMRQDAWKDDRVRVMVATNAFGMGIDKPDVRLVVHYDLPSSLEEYYQEAGRAGRDGKPAFAVLIASTSDKALLTRRLNEAFPPRQFIREVYSRLGVFFNLGVGDGYNRTFEFVLETFCMRYNLQAAPTDSAIQLLARSGYIEYASDSASSARMMIIADKRELYDLRLQPKQDMIFQALQRKYTGLFADYVDISETYIASITGTLPQDVYETLLLLSRMHVVSYIPRRMHPYIYYPQRRLEESEIVIPRDVYEVQQQRAAERMNAMRDFAFGTDRCRNRMLLEYFGENESEPCGRCDVCRARAYVDQTEPEEYGRRVLDMLRAAPNCALDMQQIVATDPSHSAQLIEAIRSLADNALIELKDSMLSLREE